MGLDRIVCLANSYKHDHRCVAGISLVTKKWVRLVGRAGSRLPHLEGNLLLATARRPRCWMSSRRNSGRSAALTAIRKMYL